MNEIKQNEKKGVSKKIMNVTPEMAAQWLKTNCKKQRKVSRNKVQGYAASMKAGDWEFTGEGLTGGSPVLMLRNLLTKNALSDQKYDRVAIDAIIINAWNAFREGVSPKSLKWKRGGKLDFPQPK